MSDPISSTFTSRKDIQRHQLELLEEVRHHLRAYKKAVEDSTAALQSGPPISPWKFKNLFGHSSTSNHRYEDYYDSYRSRINAPARQLAYLEQTARKVVHFVQTVQQKDTEAKRRFVVRPGFGPEIKRIVDTMKKYDAYSSADQKQQHLPINEELYYALSKCLNNDHRPDRPMVPAS